MTYQKRYTQEQFKSLLKQFPAVCILGPRQCGKTTFAKHELPQWHYFDLEKPSDIAQIQSDPETFLEHYPEKIIFDEAQQAPTLFPILRSIIDEKRKAHGRFVLLGSASPKLIRQISETLAGRIGFLDMTPFHFQEVKDMSALWVHGGFPDAFFEANANERQNWFEAYTRTFIERDLNLYGIDISAPQMRRFMTMLAHVHGGLLNLSELGNALGFSYHTAQRYLDILQQTFLVRLLKPFFVNVGKRLVKSPKVYIRDTGLLHYFLGIHNKEELLSHPKRGASWEGFVIEQIASWLLLQDSSAESFFLRTGIGQEVDLLIKRGKEIIPIEIKTQKAITAGDVKELFTSMKDFKFKRGYVVYPFETTYSLGNGVEVVSLEKIFNHLT